MQSPIVEVPPQERPSFFDPGDFPFVPLLERSASIIRRELDRVLDDDAFSPWLETGVYSKGWSAFALRFFGHRFDENCLKCPRSTEIVEQVPNLMTAGFSRLAAGARIKPHVGYTSRVLRCHLGLISPPRCGIRVGGETRSWTEGKCLIFDDTIEHEAWNESSEDRVVLLLDFLKEGANEPGAEADQEPSGSSG